MTYNEAITAVRAAKHVARSNWPAGQFAYREPSNPAVPGEPGYLTLHSVTGDQRGWVAPEDDVAADDWTVVA
jgi:hypothetical protein